MPTQQLIRRNRITKFAAAVFGFVVLVSLGQVRAQTNTEASLPPRGIADKIIAIVGDTVILASELEVQTQLYVMQTRQQLSSKSELHALQQQLLNDMINEQLFVAAAKKDTTIQVRDEEIEAAVDEQIARVSKNFSSNEEFLAALSSEGLTLRELRKRYLSGSTNQLYKQRAMQRRLYSISISKHEVEEYYRKFKDSIPSQPEAMRLARILLPIAPSQQAEDSVKQLAASLRDRALKGSDFATLSSHYSMEGVKDNGGDLGFMTADEVVPEFSRAAFNLSVGEISGVVRTQFGYHVIKCEEIKGDKRHLRHILLQVIPTAADTARVVHLADSLITVVKNGGDFAELAKAFSEDNETRVQGGEMGWVALREMPEDLLVQLKGWTTVGELRGPLVTKAGVQVIKLLEYSPEKVFTLETDYDRIKEFARQDKAGHQVDQWVADLRKHTFVESRLDDAN